MANPTISLTESQVNTALRSFLVSVLPSTMEVIRGQLNRVAEPQGNDFAVFWPLNRTRLSTNANSYADVAFVGSISNLVLTVSQILAGVIVTGQTIYGAVAANTVIGSQLTGPSGGTGTYNVSPSQTVASTTMQTGSENMEQSTTVSVQIDVHGPNSADNAQIISTLFRDDYATTQFATSGFDVNPLYADDPKLVPYDNGEQQIEERWIIDAMLQINPIVQVPQQFASSVAVKIQTALY